MIWLQRVLRGIKFTLFSLLALFLTLLALVSAIVATERGTRLTINLVADRVPMLELGYIQGNMLTGLDVSYLDYRFEDQQYRVESLSFRWQPLALLYNTVSVQSLSAGSVLLVLPQGEGESEPRAEDWEWPSLALPVRIELGGIDIRDIRIVAGEQVTELERVSGSLSHGTFNLRIHDLAVVAPDFDVEANGRIGLRYPYNHDLSVDWSYRLPLDDDTLALAGRGDLSGDIQQLGLRHQLTAPVALETEVRFAPHLDDTDQNPYLELEGRWQDLSPPAQFWLLEQPAPVSTAQLTLSGWLDDYRLQLEGDVRQQGLPPLNLNLNANGDLSRARVEELLLGLDGALLRINGDLAWAEPATDQQFQWDIQLALDEFQTREWLEDWPGEIRLAARTQGHIGEDGIEAAVQDLALDGQLRGLMLAGRGGISYSNELLSATGFRLSLGANQLSLDGSLGESFDLRWNLVAPILEQLDPSLGGSLLAEGQLSGDVSQPELQLTLSAGSLRWQDYQIEQLSLVAEESGGHYEISGEANDLALAGQSLSQITLSGVGSVAQHRVETRVVSETLGEIMLALAGGYQDDQWQGAVDALDIRPLEQPRVWLLRNQGLTLSAEAVALQDLCLTTWGGRRNRSQMEDGDNVAEVANEDTTVAPSPQERPALCADGDWTPAEGLSLVAELSALPLGLFQSELKPEASLGGVLEGRVRVRQEPGQNLHANLNMATRGGEFRYQYGDEDVDIYAWQRAELTAGWIDNRLEANIVTELEGYGNANATLNLNTETRTLAGEVRAYFTSLSPLEALVPRLHEVNGELNVDMRLGGTLDDPRVIGSVDLSEASAALPELGLQLEQVGLNLVSNEQGQVTLSGQVVSEPGRLTLNAEVNNLGDADWQVSARVEGEDFQVIQTRPLQARLSPSITAQASAQEIRIEGLARIPQALADIKTLPATAVRTSDDIVLVNGVDDEREVLGIPLHLNLRLQLGDDVRFQGFGLESRLSGSMTLLHSPTRGMLTTGEVGVAEGVYKAYGQDLSIERGRLIFQGPYDNPGLDIRAERTITGGGEEIVVGLEIGGTLQRPRSRIFSNPTQSDSDAMAMLLTGRPLSGSSNADASMLVNAIGTLGLERSNFITAEIAQTFGLDEFTVQTGDNLEESSLFIGKYITPRLFVRYVVGLFDQANSVGVRYQLTESLRLEAESGTQQSVDMIYKFER